jgi:hypothetical protein
MQTNQTNEFGAEQTRLQEDREGRAAWKKWGPYLSERQCGTVREDYCSNGDAWNHFTTIRPDRVLTISPLGAVRARAHPKWSPGSSSSTCPLHTVARSCARHRHSSSASAAGR